MRPYLVEDIPTKIPQPHQSLQHLLEAHRSGYPRQHAQLLDTEIELRFNPVVVPMNIVKIPPKYDIPDRSGNAVALGGWNVSR